MYKARWGTLGTVSGKPESDREERYCKRVWFLFVARLLFPKTLRYYLPSTHNQMCACNGWKYSTHLNNRIVSSKNILFIRDRMRSDFVAFVEIFIDQLIVRSIVSKVSPIVSYVKSHRDVAAIGIDSIFQYSVVDVVVLVSYGIIKSEEYHLRNLLWI